MSRLLNLPHMPATLQPPPMCQLVPSMFLWHVQPMPEDHNIPISHDDLTFTVHMALRKAEHLWPKRRRPGDHDRLKPVAGAVVANIELCGIRCFRRAPERGRTTPDPWGLMRELEERDDSG